MSFIHKLDLVGNAHPTILLSSRLQRIDISIKRPQLLVPRTFLSVGSLLPSALYLLITLAKFLLIIDRELLIKQDFVLVFLIRYEKRVLFSRHN
jgi:hypothetical protein